MIITRKIRSIVSALLIAAAATATCRALTPAEIQQLVSQHDALVDSVAASRLGLEMRITDYKIGASQRGRTGSAACIVFSNRPLPAGQPADRTDPDVIMNQLAKAGAGASYDRPASISRTLDPSGAYVLDYDGGTLRVTCYVNSGAGIADGLPPVANTHCHVYYYPSPPRGVDAIIALAESAAYMGTYDAEQAAFKNVLAQMNALRKQLGNSVKT